ncbi:hypothetical protein PPYC1_06545 [Paenibacillus polymyxa]|uniref:hypothetical protein n=1 Tax=Paenibacillus polymyxa TaxID=1406 RepID=UPI0008FC7043|nr:hypothetical protein [Paenibacillus polymyxa]APB70036.1 hypothetical protein PPYC1_06545 [Paenibacillus polymyxa]
MAYNGGSHQIIINHTSIEFYENLKPYVAREPLKLTFSEEQEGKLIIVKEEVNPNGTRPTVKEKSVKLSEHLITQLLRTTSDVPISNQFVEGKVGGSVNYRS